MTPEHLRVAAFLLQAEDSSPIDRGRSPEMGERGVALAARSDAGPVGGANPPATKAPSRGHGLAALAALIKLMIVLLALVMTAPEILKFRQKARPGVSSAASDLVRSAPGVPAGATKESKPMQFVKRSVVSGCAVLPLLFASSALAQGAVEWKASEGGNGHWYRVNRVPLLWSSARSAALSLGGDLSSIETRSEMVWLDRTFGDVALEPGGPCHLGGRQDSGAASVSAGWRWLTGDLVNLNNFDAFAFDDWPGAGSWGVEDGQQDFLHAGGLVRYLGDINDVPWPGLGEPLGTSLIEWSADCNGDGTVDYGQILSGELADANGNNIPDCCEDGSACVSSLVANASFEAGSPLAACVSESITAPNMLGSAWQVSAGTVDRVRGGTACASSTQPKFGDYAVDLCGTPASSGAIRQIVATIPGHKYRCTFWLSGDASAGPATKKVRAKVGTYVNLSYTFTCSGSGPQTWVANQFEFTARGASETLEFAADNGVTTGGPMLDAINLADITTQCVGDIDGSGDVDGADIALVLLNYGPCSTTP